MASVGTALAVDTSLSAKPFGLTYERETIMRNSGKAPTMTVWIIALVLYFVALVAHFGIVAMNGPVATWSWIIGFGLLLVACRVRGL